MVRLAQHAILRKCNTIWTLDSHFESFLAATLVDMDQGPSKKRKRYAGSHQDDWGRVFNGVIVPSKVDDHHAWCVVCARDVNVLASGVYDVKSHLRSKLHEKNAKPALHHALRTTFFKAKASAPETEVTTAAEVMFCDFVAEHSADHFCGLAPTAPSPNGFNVAARRRR